MCTAGGRVAKVSRNLQENDNAGVFPGPIWAHKV